jgi:hypothetical protein
VGRLDRLMSPVILGVQIEVGCAYRGMTEGVSDVASIHVLVGRRPHTGRDPAPHRRLDRLQALGLGILRQQVPARPKPPTSAPSAPVPLSAADRHALILRQNAESVARLGGVLQQAEADCGGKLLEWPVLGMTDEVLRNCTLHARAGNVFQVVVAQEGATPLRLYVFSTERAHKVYTVDGIVTAILPP